MPGTNKSPSLCWGSVCVVGHAFNRQQAGCNSASSFLLVQSLESRKGESLGRPQLFLEHKHSSGHMSVHIPGTILEFLKLPWTSPSLAFWVGLTVSPTVIYCLKQAQCSAIVCNCFQNSPLGKRLLCWVSSKSSQTKTTSWVSLPGNYQTGQTRPVLGKGVWRIFHILPASVTARLLFTTMNMGYLF